MIMNTAIATKAGIGILALLLILLLGNMVVNSTPSSKAKGEYEYQSVMVSGLYNGCDGYKDMQCVDTKINDIASEGWKLVGFTDGILYFERQK